MCSLEKPGKVLDSSHHVLGISVLELELAWCVHDRKILRAKQHFNFCNSHIAHKNIISYYKYFNIHTHTSLISVFVLIFVSSCFHQL